MSSCQTVNLTEEKILAERGETPGGEIRILAVDGLESLSGGGAVAVVAVLVLVVDLAKEVC